MHTAATPSKTPIGGGDHMIIRNIAADFTDAWNRHDMVAFAQLFADDADFVNVVGMWWKSRPEIQAAHEHSHRTFFRNSRLTGDVQGMKFLRPDVAVVHVVWKLSGQIDPDGSTGKPRRGVLALVLVKHDDGRWLIQVAQNTDIVAGALTQPAPKQGT